jgi:hypothetical protein
MRLIVETSFARGWRTYRDWGKCNSSKRGSGILCSLESIDAAELIETQFAERVNQEIEKIKDL